MWLPFNVTTGKIVVALTLIERAIFADLFDRRRKTRNRIWMWTQCGKLIATWKCREFCWVQSLICLQGLNFCCHLKIIGRYRQNFCCHLKVIGRILVAILKVLGRAHACDEADIKNRLLYSSARFIAILIRFNFCLDGWYNGSFVIFTNCGRFYWWKIFKRCVTTFVFCFIFWCFYGEYFWVKILRSESFL